MSPRRQDQRLADILAAVDDITEYLHAGDLHDGRTYAACRLALIEIGEATKHLEDRLLDTAPDVDWRGVMGMRDFLVHRYFDTDHAVVEYVIEQQLPALRLAVERFQQQMKQEASSADTRQVDEPENGSSDEP